MYKVRITVLETTFNEALAREYGAPNISRCPAHSAGQSYETDYRKPEGFCDEAWKAIYQYVFAFAHGGGKTPFYHNGWMKEPGVAICSCNDGLRTVIFKIEATDEWIE